MARDTKLREMVGTDPGFRVPDGYFAEAYSKVMANLPEYEEAPKPRYSRWVRMRPYVYLAAMFAGIWCMMQMFHHMSEAGKVSLDNPPAVVAQAMTNVMAEPTQAASLLAQAQSTDSQVVSELKEKYASDFEQFEDDFGYELSPQYASIQVPDKLLENESYSSDFNDDDLTYTDFE